MGMTESPNRSIAAVNDDDVRVESPNTLDHAAHLVRHAEDVLQVVAPELFDGNNILAVPGRSALVTKGQIGTCVVCRHLFTPYVRHCEGASPKQSPPSRGDCFSKTRNDIYFDDRDSGRPLRANPVYSLFSASTF